MLKLSSCSHLLSEYFLCWQLHLPCNGNVILLSAFCSSNSGHTKYLCWILYFLFWYLFIAHGNLLQKLTWAWVERANLSSLSSISTFTSNVDSYHLFLILLYLPFYIFDCNNMFASPSVWQGVLRFSMMHLVLNY